MQGGGAALAFRSLVCGAPTQLHRQAHAADLDRRLTAAHESLAQHQLDLGDCQGHLQHTRNKAAALDKQWVAAPHARWAGCHDLRRKPAVT
jgi:hypothetical protein